MKARIKATGKIIDVYPVEGPINKEQMYKENDMSCLCYYESALDFNDTIDWEQRRYEIAKDVLCAFESNSNPEMAYGNPDEQAKFAIQFADELIKQLKNK